MMSHFLKKIKALRLELVEKLVTIPIHPIEFVKFLKENINMFSWSYDEMPIIELRVMVHYLNVDIDYNLV